MPPAVFRKIRRGKNKEKAKTVGIKLLELFSSRNPISFERVEALVESCPEAILYKDEQDRLPLHLACYSQQASLDLIRCLTADGTSSAALETFRQCSKIGWLPLHYACQNENKNVVSLPVLEYLVQCFPAGLQQPTGNTGYLPLHMVCASRNPLLQIVHFMVYEWPPSIKQNTATDNFHSPLHLLCANRNAKLDVIRYCVDSCPEAIFQKDRENEWTPMHTLCCHRDDVEIYDYLASEVPEALHQLDHQGRTPLHIACSQRRPLNVIQRLVQPWTGALQVVDSQDNLPLHTACLSGCSFDVIKYLIQQDPSTCLEIGNTPLAMAIFANGGRKPPPDDLVDWMANIAPPLPQDHQRSGRSLSSDQAVSSGIFRRSEVTIQSDTTMAPIPKQQPQKQHPSKPVTQEPSVRLQEVASAGEQLHLACESPQDLAVIQSLVDMYPAALDFTAFGKLPIHTACVHQAPLEVVFYLETQTPESLWVRDDEGNLPIHLACYLGSPMKSIQFLVSRWPDSIYERNNNGETPLNLARHPFYDNPDPEVVRWLQNQMSPENQSRSAAKTTTHTPGPRTTNSPTASPTQPAKTTACLPLALPPRTSSDFTSYYSDHSGRELVYGAGASTRGRPLRARSPSPMGMRQPSDSSTRARSASPFGLFRPQEGSSSSLVLPTAPSPRQESAPDAEIISWTGPPSKPNLVEIAERTKEKDKTKKGWRGRMADTFRMRSRSPSPFEIAAKSKSQDSSQGVRSRSPSPFRYPIPTPPEVGLKTTPPSVGRPQTRHPGQNGGTHVEPAINRAEGKRDLHFRPSVTGRPSSSSAFRYPEPTPPEVQPSGSPKLHDRDDKTTHGGGDQRPNVPSAIGNARDADTPSKGRHGAARPSSHQSPPSGLPPSARLQPAAMSSFYRAALRDEDAGIADANVMNQQASGGKYHKHCLSSESSFYREAMNAARIEEGAEVPIVTHGAWNVAKNPPNADLWLQKPAGGAGHQRGFSAESSFYREALDYANMEVPVAVHDPENVATQPPSQESSFYRDAMRQPQFASGEIPGNVENGEGFAIKPVSSSEESSFYKEALRQAQLARSQIPIDVDNAEGLAGSDHNLSYESSFYREAMNQAQFESGNIPANVAALPPPGQASSFYREAVEAARLAGEGSDNNGPRGAASRPEDDRKPAAVRPGVTMVHEPVVRPDAAVYRLAGRNLNARYDGYE